MLGTTNIKLKKMRNVASRWRCIKRNILTMHGPLNVTCIFWFVMRVCVTCDCFSVLNLVTDSYGHRIIQWDTITPVK